MQNKHAKAPQDKKPTSADQSTPEDIKNEAGIINTIFSFLKHKELIGPAKTSKYWQYLSKQQAQERLDEKKIRYPSAISPIHINTLLIELQAYQLPEKKPILLQRCALRAELALLVLLNPELFPLTAKESGQLVLCHADTASQFSATTAALSIPELHEAATLYPGALATIVQNPNLAIHIAPGQWQELAKQTPAFLAAISKNRHIIKTLFRAEQWLELAKRNMGYAKIILTDEIILQKIGKLGVAILAEHGEDIAEFIALLPRLRSCLNTKQWRSLILDFDSIAVIALSNRSWKVVEQLSANDLVRLAGRQESWAAIIFRRFQAQSKFSTEDWLHIAQFGDRVAIDILNSKVASQFSAQQLCELAAINKPTAQVILDKFHSKLLLFPELYHEVLRSSMDAKPFCRR